MQREGYLREQCGAQDPERLREAAASEDAFDAAVSALVMSRHASELLALPPARDELDRLEGRIWAPGLGSSSGARLWPIAGAPRVLRWS